MERAIRQPVIQSADRRILNWISEFNYWTEQQKFFDLAEPLTGQRFLDSVQFRSWIEGEKRFLWCPGNRKSPTLSRLTVRQPVSARQSLGTSSSMIMATKFLSSITFEHLRKAFEGVDDVAIACFYLNWQESRTTTDIIANLLKQLLERNPTLSKEITDLYEQYQGRRETKLSSKDICQLFHREASQISSFFIIIDALDECTGGETSCTKILFELGKIPNVRLMITGRPGVEHVVLSKCKDTATLEIRASDEDIRKAIDTQLITTTHTVSGAMEEDPTLRSDILDVIVIKASGMYYPPSDRSTNDTRFLLASLYLKFLERQRNKHLIRPALRQLSTDLIKTYDAAIARIRAEPDQRDIEIALRALMWITFAREPLQAEVLLHALAVSADKTDIKESDLDDIQNVVSLCVGLASVDRKCGEIRLVHETTKEYLQKYFGDEDGNGAIAKVCLRYFSFPAFSMGFKDVQSLKEHLDKYKLSHYAVRYWFVHIREANLEEKLATAVLKTFEKQDTRDSVFQIAQYVKHTYRFWDYYPAGIQLLHLAAMHGLAVLCREILRQTSRVQKL
jgi:hypothetical protein